MKINHNSCNLFKHRNYSLIISILFALGHGTIISSLIPSLVTKSSILLGTIQFMQSVERELELPILYKGKEYVAKVEVNGDTRKAHFELYIENISEIHLLITDYLALPDNPNVQYLCTSKDHEHRLFKLTKIPWDNTETNQEMLATWHIDEIISSKKAVIIPDNTIIVFIEPSAVEKIHPTPWSKDSNIIHFPIIKLKESITRNNLYDLADKMKLAFLDFKFLHKKANLASIPFANNRLLSMPFSTRRPQT